MSGMMRRVFISAIVMQVFPLGILLPSEAKNLTDVLVQGFSFSAGGLDTAASAKAVAPTFSAALAQAVARVPVASGAPSFIYRYNPAVDIFERLTGVPGPLFSERALTLGRGQFDVSVGYSFIDFDELNGTDLDNIRSPALLLDVTGEAVPFRGQPPNGVELRPGEELVIAPSSGVLLHTRINLQAHLAVPTVRYGITDSWEVGLSIPVVNTFLRVGNESVPVVDVDPASASLLLARDAQGNLGSIGFIDPAGNLLGPSQVPLVRSQLPPQRLTKTADSSTGVGDITLRSKYHFWRSKLGGGALGLNLQLPSGEKKNFHGTGETHLLTFVYLSQVLRERFESRLNVGMDFNAGDVDRSSFLYTVGGTLLIGAKLGLIVDFIGRSEFGRFSVRIPEEGKYLGVVLDRAPDTCMTERPCFVDLNRSPVSFPFFSAKIKRNDIADFSFAFRYALGGSGSIFFGGIVPINDDGLRANFIPSGGIEYTF